MESLNIQLQPFFEWLLRTTVQASVLIALILLVQLILRGKLGIRWGYCLWLVLLIRMAMPWAPQSRVSMFNLIPQSVPQRYTRYAPEEVTYKSTKPNVVEMVTGESAAVSTAKISQDTSKAVPATPEIREEAADQLRPGSFEVANVLPLVWLTGALVLAVYVCAGNFHLWRLVTRERPLTDQDILDLLEDCKTQMGIRTILGLVVSDKVKSPALFGFIRPRLLLPAGMIETLSREELRYVFLHELGHLKRHDIYVGYLSSLLQVLHWFNPLIWLAFYRMRADRELACDALVLARLTSGGLARTQMDESKDYGRTIVSLLERFSRPRRLPSMAGILETKAQLKRRITMIARFKKNSYQWSPLAVILIIILSCVSLPDARRAKASGISAAEPETVSEAASQPTPVDPGIEGLVAYYALENDVLDSSGNYNDGTIVGDPVFVDGPPGYGMAMEFDGDDYVDCGNTENLATWTIACWAKSPAAPSGDSPSGPVHRQKNYQFNWNHHTEKSRGAAVLRVGGSLQWHAAKYEPLEADTWYHLAATYDGEDLKAYRDGELITTNDAPSGPPDAEPESLKLARHAAKAQYFTGTVDEAIIYNRALSVGEIRYLAGFRAPVEVIERSVAAYDDDAEEYVLDGGNMEFLTSSDLELGYEKEKAPENLQTVGIRLRDIQIPQGATITSAWVQFSADDIDNDWHVPDVSLLIEGELTPNPVEFTENAGDLTARLVTTASVVWDIPQWMEKHLRGPDEQTADISAIIQEIVNQPDWAAGNAIVLLFRDNPYKPSDGTREAESFDGAMDDHAGDMTLPPLLHIEYEAIGPIEPPADPLSEALDTALSFTTGGSADWFAQTTTSYYGGDAAQSGDISHSQDSWMQTTVSGTGTVKFYWKVSSEEDWDDLKFYIDGSPRSLISGSEDWQQKTYTITTSGPHVLEWRYVKDRNGDSGSDCGWVDKVEWVAN